MLKCIHNNIFILRYHDKRNRNHDRRHRNHDRRHRNHDRRHRFDWFFIYLFFLMFSYERLLSLIYSNNYFSALWKLRFFNSNSFRALWRLRFFNLNSFRALQACGFCIIALILYYIFVHFESFRSVVNQRKKNDIFNYFRCVLQSFKLSLLIGLPELIDYMKQSSHSMRRLRLILQVWLLLSFALLASAWPCTVHQNL